MKMILGRDREIRRLDRCMSENEAQLVMVYGRRRVGKTYLINEYFDNRFNFKFTGTYNQPREVQLSNFSAELNRQSGIERKIPIDWSTAFQYLRDYLEGQQDDDKCVVFFDEMPWMDTFKSGFLPAFEYFWNSWGNARKNLVFIVCGSSTSWMIDKLEKNKGGLFNRQTCRLYLEQFNLKETEEYLSSRGITWSRYDIVRCYMILGGIPYYLRLLDPEKTLAENIDNLFFRKRAELWDEFDNLYKTLFSNSENYIRIADCLSTKKGGMSRSEISKKTGLPANGAMTEMLNNMEKSGFIRIHNIYGRSKRDRQYQLSDYYSVFYFKYIKENYGKDEHFWRNTAENPSRRVWEGFVFENICWDHIGQIKSALGISGVMSELYTWKLIGDDKKKGAEIDIIIKRKDRVISLCEAKFYGSEYEIDKDYDAILRNKTDAFRISNKINETIQLVMITTFGLTKGKYNGIVNHDITMDQLFQQAE